MQSGQTESRGAKQKNPKVRQSPRDTRGDTKGKTHHRGTSVGLGRRENEEERTSKENRKYRLETQNNTT